MTGFLIFALLLLAMPTILYFFVLNSLSHQKNKINELQKKLSALQEKMDSTNSAETLFERVNSIQKNETEPQKEPNLPIETHSNQNLSSRFISWLIAGNPVAKVAIIILFFGLSYLFKYSLEYGLLSPEIRILGSLALGIALFIIGWQLRHNKSLYALILQGGAIGVLYLTIFAAFKLYGLVPMLLTFALLIVICATSIVFAILQRAMSLSIIANVGGYLAPILLSSSTSNHIALFSYYLLLSSAILMISIWQSWRILNLLGFFFTFVVSSLWGIHNFRPEFYLECQLFIVANMIIYGVLAVLLSIRSAKKEQYQTPIDLILLFGTPLSAFCLQYAITYQWEFGPAFSSLGFGLFYLVGAYITLRAWHSIAKTPSLFGLTIGLGFSTLAMPFAFTSQVTTIIWLLEGTALSWAMLTQKQYRFAQIGTLITLLAVIASLISLRYNYLTDGLLCVTLFGITSSILLFNACLWRYYRAIHSTANNLALLFISLSALFWIVWIFNSVSLSTNSITMTEPLILCFTLSVWLWYFIGRKLNWDMMCYSTLALWPVLLLSIFYKWLLGLYATDAGFSSFSWLLALVSAYYYLNIAKSHIAKLAILPSSLLHISLLWMIFIELAREADFLLSNLPWGFAVIKWSVCVTIASLIILLFYGLIKRKIITSPDLIKTYWLIGLLPVGFYLFIQLLYGLSSSGQILFWQYIPIINPLEESAIFAWMMLSIWLALGIRYLNRYTPVSSKLTVLPLETLLPLTVLAFLWANSMILRILSQLLDISWSFYALFHTGIVQVTLSLFWTSVAVFLVVIAHRYLFRNIWFAGAILLAIVVAKLIFIDSVAISGLLRAFVFIGVALLMLLIGYLAPLPPKVKQ